ncbi:hypothetical protein BGZ83_001877 [Gryganskiella cystojenkinii]|nr:hypothetical protein BGZ83_001877 [Gryganskiella cystojenkinii]
MLVCRSWYGLIGPRIWKYPRVLWSRHWSRFYPIVPSTSQFHSQQHERLHRSLKEPDHGEGSNIGQHLFPRPKDPPELLALSQDELHELDRQELEDWVMWTKQERNQRAKDHRRRKLFRKKSSGNQTSGLWRSTSVERQEQTPRTQADTDPRLSGENMALGQAYGDTNGHLADYDDDDLESDSMSEEGTSDEEGSLMRLVSGIDRLQSMIRSHLASTEDPTSLTPIATSPACSSVSLPMDTSTSSTSNLNLPFSKALRRLRRREALQDTRRRMTEMRGQDGLPASLPLQMCGPWIQVINLQQETPIPRRIGSQSWSYHSSSTPPMTPHNSTSRRRRQSRESLSLVQDLAQTHLGQDMQPTDDRWLSRFVSLIFRGATRELPAPTATTEPQAPPRLRSRRDSVTDRTLQTILESCPGLCRLTLSECHGITDQGLAMIRDSACVARQTLVSLHLAGCHQLTDRGIENLLADHTNSFQPTPVRLESLDLAGCFQISDQSLIPFLTQCGSKLIQLRVSDCDEISFRSVMTLAEHCSGIQWLDMARAGPLTEECLVSLANRCQDLEWLNLARCHPSDLEPAIPVSPVSGRDIEHVDEPEEEDEEEIEQDSISDTCIAQICTACPNLQLLDLSYIRTLTNASIESLSESAKNLVCLTIIGCSGITSVSLAYLARLRNTCGKLGCITMGDAQGISERDIEQIMQGTLSGWQKSLVDETNLGEILGRSWDE